MRNRILFLMIFSLLFPLGMSAQTINAEIEILGKTLIATEELLPIKVIRSISTQLHRSKLM